MRDCHAEVLARRGLLKYLYGELNRLLSIGNCENNDTSRSDSSSNEHILSDVDKGIEDMKIGNNKSNDIGSDLSSCPLTTTIQDTTHTTSHKSTYNVTGFNPFTVDPATGLLKLKENYVLHLYTSSQPCGNATIKKWAKGKKAKRSEFVFCCFVVWCGVVWCGVVWCGVVWCGVVWCGVV